ncbi:MAG: virulence factor family protein, partial [Steroidobacteraceae bacterium]|nr:virulence factor family protein [Steroidobacteraceae bacterium]
LYGEGDKDALCPELPAEHATTARIGKGHHLGRDYDAIANRILAFASSKAG